MSDASHSGSVTSIRRAVSDRLDGQSPVIVSILIVVVAWNATAAVTPSFIFPSMIELVGAFREAFGPGAEFSAIDNYGITVLRVAVATICCLVVGVLLGVFMGTNSRAEEYLFVYVLGTFAFPSVIWAFLAVIWFGLTVWLVAVFTVFMIVTPYVAISIKEGIEELDPNLPEMAEAFGASSFLIWQNIYIPHLYPHIFSSVRLTVTLAWKITLIAEIFGTETGLGEIINFYFQANQNDMIIAWVVPMMVFMFLVDRVLHRIEAKRYSTQPQQNPPNVA